MADSKIDIIVQTPKDIIDKLNTLLNWKNDIIGVMRSKHIARNAELNVNEGDSLEKINSELEKNTYELTAPKFPTTIGAGKPSTVVVKDVPINCYVEVDGQKFFVDENTPSGSHSFGKNLSVTTGIHGKGEQVTFYVKTKYDQDLFNGVANVTLGLPYTNFVKYTMRVLERNSLSNGDYNIAIRGINSNETSASVARLVLTLPKEVLVNIHESTQNAIRSDNSSEKGTAYVLSVRRVLDNGEVDWSLNGLLLDWFIRDDLYDYGWYPQTSINVFAAAAYFENQFQMKKNDIPKVFRNHFYSLDPNEPVNEVKPVSPYTINNIRRDTIRPIAVTLHKTEVANGIIKTLNSESAIRSPSYGSQYMPQFLEHVPGKTVRLGWRSFQEYELYDPNDSANRTDSIIIDPRTMGSDIFPWLDNTLKLTVTSIQRVRSDGYYGNGEQGGITLRTLDPDEGYKLYKYFDLSYEKNNNNREYHDKTSLPPDWMMATKGPTTPEIAGGVIISTGGSDDVVPGTHQPNIENIRLLMTPSRTVKMNGVPYIAFIVAGQAPFLEHPKLKRGDDNIAGVKELIHDTDGVMQYHIFLPGNWTYGQNPNDNMFYSDRFKSINLLGLEGWSVRDFYRDIGADRTDLLVRIATTNNMSYVGYLFLVSLDKANTFGLKIDGDRVFYIKKKRS